jgi:5-deoxy-glucuronate isomerase
LLIKNLDEVNSLIKIFDVDGFALYNLKTNSHFSTTLPAKPGRERVIFSLKGDVSVNGVHLNEKDMMYLPVETETRIETQGESVVYAAEAQGSKNFREYVKRYSEDERMRIGQTTFKRTVVQAVTEKDPANRFITGYVEETFGEWSSYPPHKHDGKPEAYIYYGINPGFAVQVILDDGDERAYVVHDYDTVLIDRGYHPHVNTSLKGSNYAWIVCAPEDSRNLQVEFHPAYKDVNLGKSHLTVK